MPDVYIWLHDYQYHDSCYLSTLENPQIVNFGMHLSVFARHLQNGSCASSGSNGKDIAASGNYPRHPPRRSRCQHTSGAFDAPTTRKHGTSQPIILRSVRPLLATHHGVTRPFHDARPAPTIRQRDRLPWERWLGSRGTQRPGLQSAAAAGGARFDAVGEAGRAARDTEAVRQRALQREVCR